MFSDENKGYASAEVKMMKSMELEVFRSDQRFRPGMDIFVNHAFEAFTIPQHTHDAIEINYVIQGTGYQFINDTVIPVKRGDIYLIPIGTSHVYRPSSPEKVRTLSVINCVFKQNTLPYAENFPPSGSELHQVLYDQNEDQKLWFHLYDTNSIFPDLFNTLLSEYRQTESGYEVVVKSLFMQIIALLHRCTLNHSIKERLNPKMTDVINYIKRHYHEDITITQAAEHAYLSVSHLQRLFRNATGTSFTAFVQNLRIQKCCELLKTTTMTIQHIAGVVGYRDMKFFHSLFRLKTGMTPMEYRKNDSVVPFDMIKSE